MRIKMSISAVTKMDSPHCFVGELVNLQVRQKRIKNLIVAAAAKEWVLHF